MILQRVKQCCEIKVVFSHCSQMEETKVLKEEIKSLKQKEELSKKTISLLKKKMIKTE